MGDLNCKNSVWGCNTTTFQGKKLYDFAVSNNVEITGPNEPTRYPSNTNIIPDILDITLTKNINFPLHQSVIPELDSDHSPVIISLSPQMSLNSGSIHRGITNWDKFSNLMSTNYKFPQNLSNSQEIDTEIDNLTKSIISAVKQSTIMLPTFKPKPIPFKILNLIKSKNNLRRYWQITRRKDIKQKLNKLTRIIKQRLDHFRYNNYKTYLSEIHPNSRHLWCTVKRLLRTKATIPPLKSGSSLAFSDEEKANAIARLLENTFQPHPVTNLAFNRQIEDYLKQEKTTVDAATKFISPSETLNIIKHLKVRKSPGIDGISNLSIKMLDKKVITAITAIFNAALRLNYFPESGRRQ